MSSDKDEPRDERGAEESPADSAGDPKDSGVEDTAGDDGPAAEESASGADRDASDGDADADPEADSDAAGDKPQAEEPPEVAGESAADSSDEPEAAPTEEESGAEASEPPLDIKPSRSSVARDSKSFYDDPYDDEYGNYDYDEPPAEEDKSLVKAPAEAEETPPPPPPPTTSLDDDDEDDGMARMTFLEHLEELRVRILRSLQGVVAAYLLATVFANQLFNWMKVPIDRVLTRIPGAELVQTTPQETFMIVWIKMPLLAAVFLGSPWLMYQAWAFIAPGLYMKEKRWAKPFIFATATLFITGGAFGYYVVLRFALTFLLGLSENIGVKTLITISSYFDTFVAIELALGVVFQLPVLIFFLTLIRLLHPGFLVTNFRYAILIIVFLAAVITPTPDVINLSLFAAPMIMLYFVGIGASYLLVWKREQRKVPWVWISLGAFLFLLLLCAGFIGYLYFSEGYQFIPRFPFMTAPGDPQV